uniref:alginate lyase family protein n=1 Tax=uncultured Draconibacterium sp. TaxID=1573823 RepID=UPI0032163E0C
MQFKRYYNTLKYLKITQIRYQLWYRIRRYWRKIIGFTYPLSIVKGSYPLQLTPCIDKPVSLESSKFTFLNQSTDYHPVIDWNESQNGKLWAYNLNYMDYLLQPNMELATGLELIDKFIADLPGNSTGLEPYPIALRGINWIKFLSQHRSQITDHATLSTINNSLYAQYCILLDNLEYHLLGNHLLEDAFSLLFGAFYFKDEKLYSKACQLLHRELEEQILKDGAHFELSPMYHQILLDRLLDCINLVQNNTLFDNQDKIIRLMREKAVSMISWINIMTFSDGTIPLLNDSTYGIAPTTNQLKAYATSLNLIRDNSCNSRTLSDSGYRKFTGTNYECIIDVGHIGPDYIPGHAHSDTFNFHLQVNDQPLIVDTGISTYNKNQHRQAERSTEAHNTVQYGNHEQSDVWGGFRVSKRARIMQLEEDDKKIKASHNGYCQLAVNHERTFESNTDSLIITDVVKGKQTENSTARFHFTPGQHPEINNKTAYFSGGKVVFSGKSEIKLKDYSYAAGYNKLQEAKCIEVTFNDQLTTHFTFN